MGMMPGLVDLAKEHGRHEGDESPNPLFLASLASVVSSIEIICWTEPYSVLMHRTTHRKV